MNIVLLILLIVIALVILFFGIRHGIGLYFYNTAMKRITRHKRFSKRKKEKDQKEEHASGIIDNAASKLMGHGDFEKEWVQEIQAPIVEMTSRDGLKLRGYLIERPDAEGRCRKFAILCHGYTGVAAEMCFEAKHFYEKGFSILLPAARGHDLSEGKHICMGWPERLDICDWIALLNQKYEDPAIILYGTSMGGATVMNTVGEDLPANVRAAIEDCGYSSIKGEYEHCIGTMLKIKAYKFLISCGRPIVRFRTGIDLYKDGFSTQQLAKSRIPMLFIHGTADTFVPFSMLEENFEAHPGPKEKLEIEGAAHLGAPWMGGELYWNTVFTFIERYI